MQNFIAVIHKDKDSAYGVHFPDVEGCFSAGDTLDEAVSNAAEALRFYFENQTDVPEARDMESIREDVQQDIREGALLVAIPLLADAGRTVRVNITLDAGLLESIDRAVEKRGMNRSAFLAQAARDKIMKAAG